MIKILIINLGLTNTTFKQLLNRHNFHITENCWISDICSSSKFEFKTFSFKCLVVSNYIVVSYSKVTLQFYIVKNSKFKEEKRPPKRPYRSETFAALKLFQNCILFEEEQVALHLQSHVEKFSVLYEKTLQLKKQQT